MANALDTHLRLNIPPTKFKFEPKYCNCIHQKKSVFKIYIVNCKDLNLKKYLSLPCGCLAGLLRVHGSYFQAFQACCDSNPGS